MTYYERNLPHWQPEGRAAFLTWRLYGSLPAGFARHLQTLKETPENQFLVADRRLDGAATGPRWLSDPRVAACAKRSICRGAELGQYTLHAYVLMLNHVDVLLDPKVPLRQISGGIKDVSAREGNAILRRSGKPFWQDESFDRWIRDGAEFEPVRAYIEANPVTAGLAAKPHEWPWSSAYK